MKATVRGLNEAYSPAKGELTDLKKLSQYVCGTNTPHYPFYIESLILSLKFVPPLNIVDVIEKLDASTKFRFIGWQYIKFITYIDSSNEA